MRPGRATSLSLLLLSLSAGLPAAGAHSCYLAEPPGCDGPLVSPDWGYLAGGLASPALLGAGALGLGGAALLLRFPSRRPDPLEAGHVPLLLRLGVGGALMASGLEGNFFTPLGEHPLSFALVPIGLLIVAGVLARGAALAAAGFWVVGASRDPRLLLSLEIPAAALALALLLPSGAPGIDAYLARRSGREPWPAPLARQALLAPTVLRAGAGLALVAGALFEKLLAPHRTAAFVAERGLATPFLGEATWVLLLGLGEAALGLALVAGVLARPAAVAGLGAVVLSLLVLGEGPGMHAALAAALLAVVVAGPGPAALEERLRRAIPRAGGSAAPAVAPSPSSSAEEAPQA